MDANSAQQLDDTPKGHYIDCFDCDGVGGHERYCECNGIGCSQCQGKGIIFTTCNTCQGEKQIWVTVDTGLDCFEDDSTIEGMKAVSNYQIRKEGK